MTCRRLFHLVLTTALGLFLAGCDLAGLNDDTSTVTSGVFVASQGQFGQGNGRVSIYDPASETTSSNAIDDLNSIVQSIRLRGNQLYVAANTAKRLDIFEASTQNQVQQITGFSGPRYLTVSDDETVFLTDQQPFMSTDPDSIRKISVAGSSPEIASSIAVSGTVEGITHTENRVYAALGGFGASSKVAVLDTDDASVEEEVDIGCRSRFVLADNQDEVFALCNNDKTGEAVILNGTKEEARLELPDSVETAGPGQDAYYSENAEELYVVLDKEQVIRINTATNEKGTTLTPSGDGNIGAIGYDAIDERLYVGRPNPSGPFTAAGSVTIHNRDGEQTGNFKAGVSPTYIDFRRVDE